MKAWPLDLAVLWQTALALPLAFISWMLGILIGGGLFALLSGAPIIPQNDHHKVWLLAVAAWIGVWAAYHVCEWLLKYYSRWSVFLMFVIATLVNFVSELGQPVFWEVIARGMQGAVTCLTAYAFFVYQPRRF